MSVLVSDLTTSDIAALPVRMDRAASAAVITRYFFPVSPRTLERWPLAVRRVNGRALIETTDLIKLASSKLAEASVTASGSKPTTEAA